MATPATPPNPTAAQINMATPAALPGNTTAADAPPAAAASAAAPLTLADVDRLVNERLTAAQKAQEDKQKATIDTARKAAAVADARKSVMSGKLKGVPDAYARDLPDTDNQTELEAAAKTIRERYQADLAAAGVKAPPVSSGGGGGVPPTSIGSKAVSAFDAIHEGLQNRPSAGRVEVQRPQA